MDLEYFGKNKKHKINISNLNYGAILYNKLVCKKIMSNFLYTSIASPLDQFEVRELLSLDASVLGNLHISLTNIGLYLCIGGSAVLSLNVLASNYDRLVSNG